MGSTFNPQILMDKLIKLNSSQQSIETLSHWCIFHMKKAKFVVETWARQFHCAPREQRLIFLYLANDILQNSRRKGADFVGEFWRVLPDALRDVIKNGDDTEKHAARRLIVIWEDRKVFGSRGQLLKEEFLEKRTESNNKAEKISDLKLKPCAGKSLEKLISGYKALYSGEFDEEAIMDKCSNTISSLEKFDKELISDASLGKMNESKHVEELQGQQAILRTCTEQLLTLEASRSSLVFNMKEALQEQESKLERVRNQIQSAQLQLDQLSKSNNAQPVNDPNFKPPQSIKAAHVSMSREEDSRKSAAAAVAEKLTASSSSAQMLSFAISSLTSKGEYPPEKRPKLDNEQFSYISPPLQNPQQLPPPPPMSSPPPLPPPPPPPPPMQPPYLRPQFMQSAGSMSGVSYNYGMTQQPLQQQPLQPPLQPPLPMPGYTTVRTPVTGISPFAPPPGNPYQNFPGSEGFYNQSQPTAPPQ